MVTGWQVKYVSGGADYPLEKFTKARFEEQLNELGTFEIVIPDPTDAEMANLKEGTEIKTDAWENSLYGYVKLAKYSSIDKCLTLKGVDYAVLLQNTHINVVNTALEDAYLSSGFRVVYDSVAFNDIAGDILTNTGISAGTIDNFGDIDIRFENKTVKGGVEFLKDYANYDWKVQIDKTLDLRARIGSAAAVYNFNTDYNCKITNWENDGETGGVYKIVVLGRGTGSSQIEGTWTHGSYDNTDAALNKTRIFIDPSISSTTQATQVADNLGALLNPTFVNCTIVSDDLTAKIQIGDAVNVTDAKRGTNLFRVMKLRRNLVGNNDAVSYELVNNDSKLQKSRVEDFWKKNQNLAAATGSSSQGSIKTITVDDMGNSTPGDPRRFDFEIPDEVLSTADILSAILVYSRVDLSFDVDSDTGDGTQNTSDSGHSAHALGTYADSGHLHSITTLVAGQHQWTSLTKGALDDDWDNDGSTGLDNTWVDVGSVDFDPQVDGYVAGSITAYIPGPVVDTDFHVRIEVGSDYFPDSGGVFLEPIRQQHDHGGSVTITGGHATCYIQFPSRHTDETGTETATLQVDFDGSGTKYWTAYMHSVKSHAHDIAAISSGNASANLAGASGTGTANIVNPTHTNALDPDVYEPGGEGSLTLDVDLNGANVASNAGDVGYASSEVDITAAIRTGGLGWQYLEYFPTTSIARLKVELKITYLAQEL